MATAQVGPPTYDIIIHGSLAWVLVAEYDNRTNGGSITEITKYTVEEEIHRSEFSKEFSETTRKQLKESGVNTEVGASYEGVSAKISGNAKVSDEVTDVVQRTTETSVKTDYKTSFERERTFVVSAESYLAIWQQKFTAPGYECMCDAITTNPDTSQEVLDVTITYTARAIQFVKDIKVVYGNNVSEAPGDRVLEIHNHSDDINQGHGGKYVWLVPVFTDDADEAATRFDLFIQAKEHKGWPDLAKGAGGQYRYLVAAADKSNPEKITALHLDRDATVPIKDFSAFDGHTSDVNAGRALSYLYFCWNTRTAW